MLMSSVLEFREALASISRPQFGFHAVVKLLIQTSHTPWRGLRCGVQPAQGGGQGCMYEMLLALLL